MRLIYVNGKWVQPCQSSELEVSEQLIELMRGYYSLGGNQVTAIKFLRVHFNLGLKEAKDLWDSIK